MKVKFLESIASPTFAYRIKEVADIDDSQATAWINNGTCEAVEDAPTEPATKKTGKK